MFYNINSILYLKFGFYVINIPFLTKYCVRFVPKRFPAIVRTRKMVYVEYFNNLTIITIV
jgi:hypothetical protein